MLRVLLLAAAVLSFASHAAGDAKPPARAWLMAVDGEVVAAHAADRPLPPASLTKLMTALLWLESPAGEGDATIVISRRAAAAGGSRAGLRAGERYRGEDLLGALLIASANDACVALAEHAAGSVEAFVAAMNAAAARLELRETRFANPCGHDAAGHVSSARDLLRLTEIALAEPRLRALFAQESLRLAALPGGDDAVPRRGRRLKNGNALLGRLPGTRGVKTGYTPAAGKCVIALVERDGHRVVLVLLNARDRWWSAHGMVEQAFARLARRDGRG